jgi:hypothetical protein
LNAALKVCDGFCEHYLGCNVPCSLACAASDVRDSFLDLGERGGERSDATCKARLKEGGFLTSRAFGTCLLDRLKNGGDVTEALGRRCDLVGEALLRVSSGVELLVDVATSSWATWRRKTARVMSRANAFRIEANMPNWSPNWP